MERQYWIRSKPVYTSLQWQNKARAHFVIAESDGGLAVLKLLQQQHPLEAVSVFYTQITGSSSDYAEVIKRLAQDEVEIFNSEDEQQTALNSALSKCTMGTQFYIAGSEKFIWSVLQKLAVFGVQDDDVNKELCGTLARSVYCVHCKAITHDVHHNIAKCAGCQRNLFVRDHFSRRLSAYMGLMIDAEEPGNLPSIDEVYP